MAIFFVVSANVMDFLFKVNIQQFPAPDMRLFVLI